MLKIEKALTFIKCSTAWKVFKYVGFCGLCFSALGPEKPRI